MNIFSTCSHTYAMLTHMREESAMSGQQTTFRVLHHISKETLVTKRAKADFFSQLRVE